MMSDQISKDSRTPDKPNDKPNDKAESADRNISSAPNPTESESAAAESAAGIQRREVGGRDGPDPTRFGDWEKAGRCIDF
jgi:hypothetical protein